MSKESASPAISLPSFGVGGLKLPMAGRFGSANKPKAGGSLASRTRLKNLSAQNVSENTEESLTGGDLETVKKIT